MPGSIYALMSFAVGERTREIGIRTALGAERRSIALAVALRSLTQLGLGILLGMPMARWMFLTTAADQGNAASGYSASVFVLLLGVGLLVLIGTLACVAPTLRALRITPTEALREGG